ncbi:Dabb family protein [Planctomicrobium piriforme]|uniref:Quinol monooxygenase YgiN n=1 Tax=Planctomicrobium piriforme TaxID=1576369 RepID=A0A1I3GTS6_9PLAN|nr:Dabb family protein [Planctomicrobium piriforme]SFI26918.1 Quinol monooxygenase YgiN [Planctomicrobium piriforme]
MKTIALFCVGMALLLFSALLVNSSMADKKKDALLRHVVLFKFKPEATPEQIAALVEAFEKLPGQISEIRDFEWGTDVSPEGLSKGFTHCFFVTFASEAARDAYLPHPAHQAFVAQLKPILEDVTVVDYWTGK